MEENIKEIDPFVYLNDSPSDFVKYEEPMKVSLEQKSSPEPEPEREPEPEPEQTEPEVEPESSPEPMETDSPSIPVKNEEPKKVDLEQETLPEPVETEPVETEPVETEPVETEPEPEPLIENPTVLPSPEHSPEPMGTDILQESETDSDMKRQLHEAIAVQTHIKCDACNTLLTKRGYTTHTKTLKHKRKINALTMVPDIANPDYYCTICEKKYDNRDIYLIHLRRVHRIVTGGPARSKIPTVCDICKEEFPSRTQYRAHYNQVHRDTNVTQEENDDYTETQNVATENNDTHELSVAIKRRKTGQKRIRQTREKRLLNTAAAAPFEKPNCMMCRVKCNMKTLYLGLFKDSVEGDMDKLHEFVSRVNPSLQLDDGNNKCDWCLAS